MVEIFTSIIGFCPSILDYEKNVLRTDDAPRSQGENPGLADLLYTMCHFRVQIVNFIITRITLEA